MNGIRAVSKKRAAENRKRKKVTDAMKEEADGYVRCAFPMTFHVDEYRGDGMWCRAWKEDRTCFNRADDAHEIVSRARGGSITDRENLLPLCREHHRWTTEHPLEAEKLGLSKRKEN